MQDDLLQRFLVSRSRADLEALVRGEHAWLLAVAQQVARDPDLAEDAVQEVFVKLIQSPPRASTVRTSRGLLAAYVIGAARTLLRGNSRREQRERVASRPEASADDRHEIEHDEVRVAVFALPDAHRECVELRYFGGLSADEIGRTLGCARRTVDERLASARESLRRQLAPHAFALFSAGMESGGVPTSSAPPRDPGGTLERLLDHPALPARASAAGAGAMVAWLAAAALVGIAALGLWSTTRGGTRSTSTAAAQAGTEPLDREARAPDPSSAASAPSSTRVALSSPADAMGVPAQAPPGIDLRVHVVDESGAHVQAGEVRFEPASLPSSAYLSLLQRDDLARFAELLGPIQLSGRNPLEVHGLPPELARDPFVAYAVVPGFGTPSPEAFALASGQLSEVVLVVHSPRTVTISVEDRATHRALADATVVSVSELERRDIDAAKALREHATGAGVSDALGDCTLDGLGSGEHEIEVHAGGHSSARATLAAGANHLALALDASASGSSITVDVKDPGNLPIAGAPVICHQIGRELDRRAATDAQGRCRFLELEPGSWTVVLDALPYAQMRSKNKWKGENECFGTAIELAAGEDKRVQLGFLAGRAAWSIEVVDAQGRPRGEMEVQVSGPVQRTARTRRDGRVLFEHLPAGKWSCEVDGWSTNARELADDSLRSDRLELGSAHIRGRVKLAGTGAPAAGAMVIASGDVYAMVACDTDGGFHFEHAPNGTFLVSVGVAGQGNAEASVEVKDGDPQLLELTVGP